MNQMIPMTPDQMTFEALIAPVLPVATRAALGLTRNAADAEDAVQQAALQAWRAFGSFEEGTNFRAWFLRIVTNVCLTEFRRRKRSPQGVSMDEPEFGEGMIPEHISRDMSDPLPDAEFITQLDSEEIADALASLPEDYRVVSTLYFIEELSYQEIAEIVGRPIGTVRSRLHRGRKLLMQKLWDLAVERGIVRPAAQESEDFSEFWAEETALVA
jgi:RNA polymerase sigma-70 factor (ECF subfamily)